MLGRDLYCMLNNGFKPNIEFNEETENRDYDPDSGMRADIISHSLADRENTFWITCNLIGWTEYNKQFAKNTWFDSDGNPTLTWFESNYYPEDGKYEMCVDLDYEVPFKVLNNNNKLYEEYKQSKSLLNYISWLENKIEELRS